MQKARQISLDLDEIAALLEFAGATKFKAGYGITMARRGGIRKREVINTLGAGDFVVRVRPAQARARA
jgi:hypothetical protein